MTDASPNPDPAGWRVMHGAGEVIAVGRGALAGRRSPLVRVTAGDFVRTAGHPDVTLLLVPEPGAHIEPVPDPIDPAAFAVWDARLAEAAGISPDADPDTRIRDCLDALARRLAAEAEEAGRRAEATRAHGERRLAEALRDLAAVVGRSDAPDPEGDGLEAVVARVAAALGVAPAGHRRAPAPETDDPRADLVALARTWGLGRRTVRLTTGFSARPGPPLVAWSGDDDRPVALVHDGRRWTISTGGPARPLTPADTAALSGAAVQLYATLPADRISFATLLRFGATGGRGDGVRIGLGLVATAALAGTLPVAAHITLDRLIPAGHASALAGLMGLLAALALAGGCFQLFRGLATFRAQSRFEARVQPALLHRLLRLPADVRRAHTVGDLADRALGIEAARRQIGAAAVAALFGGVFGFASLVPLFFYDAALAALCLVLALGVSLAVGLLALGQLRIERAGSGLQGVLDGFVMQLIVGMGKVRAAAAERRAMAEWSARFIARRRLQRAAALWAGALEIAVATLPVLATLALYAGMIGLRPADAATGLALSPAGFVAFSFGFGQVMGALSGAGLALVGLLGAIPLVERARPILDTPVESAPEGAAVLSRPGTIALRRVSFRYGPDGPKILDDLDLQIARGEFVAIVGPSGSGKSTLLRLILGLETPSAGDILFEGRGTRDLDMAALRRQIGTVLQNGRLSSGSLFENIAAGAPLDQSAAWAAVRRAGLEADIRAMPMGLHTVLLDGGATLSGGQCQRLLIARALARDPAILLFDEATSALDNRSQQVVMDTLAAGNATRLVVAHRLSTIRAADRIVVLEAGRIVETGQYDDLMARNGPFARLAARQLL